MKTPNSAIYYHIVFCTKYRRKVITEEINKRVKELLKQSEDVFEHTFNRYSGTHLRTIKLL